ncbi:MAG TPA: tyrosine-type recombinase/integrase [Rectinema sp.]|nr:tyrosine-type recombinase/integrase [Rectinema sp.]
MSKTRKNSGITYSLYKRPTSAKHRLFYIKFWDEDKVNFLTRSSKTEDEKEAHAEAGRILGEEDLKALALQKRIERSKEQQEKRRLEAELKALQGTEADRIAGLSVNEALKIFWDPERSPYLQDLKDAGRLLSNHYINENKRNIIKYLSKYGPFNSIKMKDISFAFIDEFFRHARHNGLSRYTINSILNTMRAPCTWISARGAMPQISFKGITLPEKKARERGLITPQELEKILALETAPVWFTRDTNEARIDTKPRPRLPNSKKNKGDPPLIGLREKLAIVIGALTGMRLGEIRALRWKDVDLEQGIISVSATWADEDKRLKQPKAGSSRNVVISASLEKMLIEARKTAQELGAANDESFVLFNPADPGKPISETTIKRAWNRILRAIGISEEEQKKRNLVFHGLRHFYATRLVDSGLEPQEAAKLTGHRILATLGRYSNHIQKETLQKARNILDKTLYNE